MRVDVGLSPGVARAVLWGGRYEETCCSHQRWRVLWRAMLWGNRWAWADCVWPPEMLEGCGEAGGRAVERQAGWLWREGEGGLWLGDAECPDELMDVGWSNLLKNWYSSLARSRFPSMAAFGCLSMALWNPPSSFFLYFSGAALSLFFNFFIAPSPECPLFLIQQGFDLFIHGLLFGKRCTF